jgi:hypothetical protein
LPLLRHAAIICGFQLPAAAMPAPRHFFRRRHATPTGFFGFHFRLRRRHCSQMLISLTLMMYYYATPPPIFRRSMPTLSFASFDEFSPRRDIIALLMPVDAIAISRH